MVVPEKVRFRFMLEGQDRDWREAVNERRVEYSNLPPRQYRFRVTACNNSGVWNETGDTLEFSIAPAYYQTAWFYASCVAAFLAMLWGLYRLRLYQVRREFNAQLDGRVDERMRVARELHDTLLQSFQASLIQMQAARNVLTRRPEKAEQSLDKAITTAAGAVAEGRDAIQNLRAQPAGEGDLAQLLTAAGQELAHSDEAPENPPVFRLTVEGERRDLEPLLQDEVYRIARELLRNAFRHAQAGRIEAEIRYESRQLRVHIRDDGKGIDPEVLKAGGRAGHWGLPGMRERVDRFGGKLEFWSEAGAGTEAVLTVPAAAAYGASNGGAFSFLRRKKARS
jgi:signal transduction histidine kinase